MSNINVNDNTPHSETLPAMPDPPVGSARKRMPHPQANPCAGCPRFKPEIIIRYGSVSLNQMSAQVTWRGIVIPAITRCEFRVLTLLVTSQGYAIRYRAIYDVIQSPGFIAGTPGKGFTDGCHGNVRSAIKRIRKKFLAIDPTFKNIVNHQAVGYSWSMD